jgi:excisionase family DNA binding protein
VTDGQSNMSHILTLAEAAKFLRCSRSHLSNLLNGKVLGMPPLPVVRVGRRCLFIQQSLEAWVRQVESAGLVAAGKEQ